MTASAACSGGDLGRQDVQLGVLGLLVGRPDPGEVGELAPAGLGVETLAVAGLGDLERRVDEDLEEAVLVR